MTQDEKKTEVKKVSRKTLKELFNEPCTIKLDRAFMHQAFTIPHAGTESTLSKGRPGSKDLDIVYHPGYGLIGYLKGKYFLSPTANVIVAHEEPMEQKKAA